MSRRHIVAEMDEKGLSLNEGHITTGKDGKFIHTHQGVEQGEVSVIVATSGSLDTETKVEFAVENLVIDSVLPEIEVLSKSEDIEKNQEQINSDDTLEAELALSLEESRRSQKIEEEKKLASDPPKKTGSGRFQKKVK